MADKVIYYKRAFLNKEPDYRPGVIVAAITADEDEYDVFDSMTFLVSDCRKGIELDFNFHDEKSLQNSLYKLEVLESTVREFKQAYIEFSEKKMKLLKEKREKKESRTNDLDSSSDTSDVQPTSEYGNSLREGPTDTD